MFRINDAIQYIRFLRHKDELEIMIKEQVLSTEHFCKVCRFKYKTMEDIYKRLPMITRVMGKEKYILICNNCREVALNKLSRYLK